ncbi:hypothetical protein HNR10_005907 [Nocardiopsis aegyptia]|uniref:Uncharacterized protein n=1 Tax=Nocardiopsis aegyptia TaxID=220378 RepID=A0A7Z0JD76_9ACTN|nr:hypothetical protein [Nocardiopsis aegyptia]
MPPRTAPRVGTIHVVGSLDPNAAAVIARRAVETPASLRHYARSAARLTGAGWLPARRSRAGGVRTFAVRRRPCGRGPRRRA